MSVTTATRPADARIVAYQALGPLIPALRELSNAKTVVFKHG